MSLVNDLRREITRCINTLRRRHGNTADETEKETIMKSIEDLNDQLALLNQEALLDSATAVAAATDAVERAIGAAKTGPFDGYLAAMEDHFNSLHALGGDLQAGERLPAAAPEKAPAARAPAKPSGRSPKAKSKGAAPRRGRATDAKPAPAPAAPAPSPAPAAAAPAPAAATPRGLPPPLSLTEFAGLKDEYQVYFDACLARPDHKDAIEFCRSRLEKGRPTYEEVGASLGGIPWVFIGVIHGMECSFNFAGHLHNGDPLTARTVQVPPGRPRTGSPPFTWRESASDALTMKGLDRITDWSVPHMLFLLESYNGFGYRSRGVPSPYLWSFSNLYEKGKFVADGVFDPEAVSRQCGAAVMLKAVLTA